jgi:tRNA-modifying protein YgfZ
VLVTRFVDLNATLIEVRGDDARPWLNGQLTCDVNALTHEMALRGLRLNKNGRIVAVVHIIDRPGGVDLVVPREHAEEVACDLDRYVIMEDVELRVRLETHVIALLEADHAPEGAVTASIFGHRAHLLTSLDVAQTIDALGATPIAPDEAEWLRVAAGDPGAPELERGLLPQEAGLKALVSFDKGCYLGQEPVVMLEHRGRAPKRLARLRLMRASAPGAQVSLESGEVVGEVTSAASTNDEALAMALLKKRAEGDEPLWLEGARVLERTWVGEV